MLDQMFFFIRIQLHLIEAQLFLKFMPFGARSLSFMLKMSLHSEKSENTVLSVERDEVSEEMSDSRSSMKFGQYGVANAVYTIIAASNQSHTN